MASVQKDSRTGNLVACFNIRKGPSITRFNLSLGTRDRSLGTAKRSFAQDLASDIEDAAHGVIGRPEIAERLSKIPDIRIRARVEAIFSKAMEVGLGKTLDSDTVEGAVKKWMERQVTQVGTSTVAAYQAATKRFLDFLGARRSMPLEKLTRQIVEDFHANMAKLTSPTTAYHKIKILRVFLKDAMARYGLTSNPAAGIKKGAESGQKMQRRPFSVPQLQAIEKECTGEWRGMFLFGLYSGQRLSDIATLRWHNLRLDGPEATWSIRFISRKTRRQMDVPLAAHPLRNYIIDELPAADDENSYVFPEAATCVEAAKGRAGTLSNVFRQILKSAGIVESIPNRHPKNPKGRGARRDVSVYSFHSLRHTAVSLLKNAGISPEIVMDIIGHESAAVSAAYTHISHEAKVAALASMPLLGASKQPKKTTKAKTQSKKPKKP